MTRTDISALLRRLADGDPEAADADLLARFAATRDEAAFAALVRRHGRLVWSVCHGLAGPDADDAFQAVFLVLVRNAGKPRIARNLSGWLYGVARRVCSRARRSAARRTGREKAAAVPDKSGAAVPDSAWDRALAAVHEEVAKLPETLRAPFVLCALGGASVTEAADRLGWKLSTFSARLARAKGMLLARLDARGVAASAVAAVAGASVAPAASVANAAGQARTGTIVAGSILQLTQGVLSMSAYQAKVLAAGLLVAAGLGGGSAWVGSAGAQVPGGLPPAAKADPAATPAKVAPTDQDAIQGTWQAAAMEDRDGRKSSDEWLKTFRMTFAGNRLVFYTAREDREYTFALDSAAAPKAMDLTPAKGKKQPCAIYKLDGDTLVICLYWEDMVGKRPTEFKPKVGEGAALITLKRVPEGPAAEAPKRGPTAAKPTDPAEEVKRLKAELESARERAAAAQEAVKASQAAVDVLTRQLLDKQAADAAMALRAERAKEAEAERLIEEARRQGEELLRRNAVGKPQAMTAKWYYAFKPAAETDMARFTQLLIDEEAKGWEFVGQVTMKEGLMWTFRKLRPEDKSVPATPSKPSVGR